MTIRYPLRSCFATKLMMNHRYCFTAFKLKEVKGVIKIVLIRRDKNRMIIIDIFERLREKLQNVAFNSLNFRVEYSKKQNTKSKS